MGVLYHALEVGSAIHSVVLVENDDDADHTGTIELYVGSNIQISGDARVAQHGNTLFLENYKGPLIIPRGVHLGSPMTSKNIVGNLATTASIRLSGNMDLSIDMNVIDEISARAPWIQVGNQTYNGGDDMVTYGQSLQWFIKRYNTEYDKSALRRDLKIQSYATILQMADACEIDKGPSVTEVCRFSNLVLIENVGGEVKINMTKANLPRENFPESLIQSRLMHLAMLRDRYVQQEDYKKAAKMERRIERIKYTTVNEILSGRERNNIYKDSIFSHS